MVSEGFTTEVSCGFKQTKTEQNSNSQYIQTGHIDPHLHVNKCFFFLLYSTISTAEQL